MQELIKVNNNLTYLMKKKRALQDYIRAEEDRIKGIDPRQRIWELHNDEEFIKQYGRKRKSQEIAIIVGYSQRQVQRFLKEKD